MSERYILDDEGRPKPEPDLFKWGRWFEIGERRVAKTEVGRVLVSTVFLGIDHSFDLHGPPLVFQTMVFGGPLDGEQERYTTKDEAIAGHAAMVARLKRGLQ